MNANQMNDLLMAQEMAYQTMLKHGVEPNGQQMAIHLEEHHRRMKNALYAK